MKWKHLLCLTLALLLFGGCGARAQDHVDLSSGEFQSYILAPNDVVDIKVYQEDDLETKARIGQDGSIPFPLIGSVQIGGKTIAEAVALIAHDLRENYLVNPQLTLIVTEYSKRRFTVLGQVQKPGSFEIPSEENVTLLEAIAMAGGYTRLANKSAIQITRMVAGKMETITLDMGKKADNPDVISFKILPDDTITILERIF